MVPLQYREGGGKREGKEGKGKEREGKESQGQKVLQKGQDILNSVNEALFC